MEKNKCTGEKYCDCAREAMKRGANRDWVDGTEDDCPFRKTKETQVQSPTKNQDVEQTAEEVLKRCLLKWCPEKEKADFEKDWKGRVDNDVFNAINEAMTEYSSLRNKALQERVKELGVKTKNSKERYLDR